MSSAKLRYSTAYKLISVSNGTIVSKRKIPRNRKVSGVFLYGEKFWNFLFLIVKICTIIDWKK